LDLNHDLFAALPESSGNIPNAILSSQEEALAVRVTIRSLGVALAANGRLAGICTSGLSLNGIEVGGKNIKCVVTSVETAGTFSAIPVPRRPGGTQEREFHSWVWERKH
jgi:hypothetical protein